MAIEMAETIVHNKDKTAVKEESQFQSKLPRI